MLYITFKVIEDFFLTGGNKADISFANVLTKNVKDCYVVEEKGYDSDKHRKKLQKQYNISPGRKNRIQPIITIIYSNSGLK
ncbi:MAG: hypothetical protein P857_724 [Candidatus Xenolissoclinum pacificiensis L6]|uniref:Uncharacterized protein n=1 Tax=Candidatus Xenolissoclinum pacificiensis L6 TaxID=1401685 RepID=W2UYQ5_9RICK|nr:MAG: hypothetical protein P857_724 [Candidatus Xenolissoclinum pacificiensis L6]